MKRTYGGYKIGQIVALDKSVKCDGKLYGKGEAFVIEVFPPKVRIVDDTDKNSKGQLYSYFVVGKPVVGNKGDIIRALITEIRELK